MITKRLLPIFLSAVLLLAFAACAKTSRIKLPFSPEDVETIELYRFHLPTSAEQKTVTSKEDIQSILDTILKISVKENKLEMIYGATVTSFRFNLKDGTDVEVIYVSRGVKQGEIMSSYLFNYQTSADIGSIWDRYGENQQTVREENLPSYED